MSQTIIDLWNGELAPCERCGAGDRNIYQLRNLMNRNQQKLCEELTECQIRLFQKYIDCSEEYLFRMQESAFLEGFSLGSKLTAEALVGK